MNRYLILFILIPCFQLIAENRDSSLIFEPGNLEKFIERLNYSESIQNKNLVAINYGIANLSFPNKDIISEFANVFPLEFRYGFVRIDEDFKGSGFAYISSETAFMANYSSHLITKALKDDGKTTDSWQFGFDFTNGYGYNNKVGSTFFIHSGGLGWVSIDFENLGESVKEQKLYDLLDRKIKFGIDFETGLRHYLNNSISIDAIYRHSVYYPDFQFADFLGSYLPELLIQRTIDYFGEDFIITFPNTLPIINWSVKSAVSFIFYELRRKKMYYPVSSQPSINYDGFKAGISYTF